MTLHSCAAARYSVRPLPVRLLSKPQSGCAAALAEAGTPIYVATAKDKLLKLLTHGLDAHPAPSFGFSAGFADREAESAALSAAFPAAPGSSSVPTL